jgi:hypothetical protein
VCGIAGWNLTEKPGNEFFSTLAAVMQSRGEQAYGVYHGGTIVKGVGPILEKLPASKMASLAGFLHTRHATHGDVIAVNSHPFEMGDLVGAHNGVLSNHFELNLTHKRGFKVDSMHIFQHILDGLPLSEIKGYGAIEYYRDGAFFVGCCNGGSLEVALTSAGVVWASTSDAIEGACGQAGIELKHFYKVDQGKIYRIETDAMYTTDLTFRMSERPKDAKGWESFGSNTADSKTAQENWWLDEEKESAMEAEITARLEAFKNEEFYKSLSPAMAEVALENRRDDLADEIYTRFENTAYASGESSTAGVPTDAGVMDMGEWFAREDITDDGSTACEDKVWEEFPLTRDRCDLCRETKEVADYQSSYVCEGCFYVLN